MDADTLLSNLQSQANNTQSNTISEINTLMGAVQGLLSNPQTIQDKNFSDPGTNLTEAAITDVQYGVGSTSPDFGTWPIPSATYQTRFNDNFVPTETPSSFWPVITPGTITEPSTGPTWPAIEAKRPTDGTPAAPVLTEAPVDGAIDFNLFLANDVTLVEGAVRSWVNTYAPQYAQALAQLEQFTMDGIANGAALPATIEAAMINRKRKSLDRERIAAEQQAARVETARGGDVLQPMYFASLRAINAQYSDQIAAHNEEVFLWRSELEVKHRQFCMQTATQLHSTITQIMVNWGGLFVQYKGALANYWAAIARIKADAHNAKMDEDVKVYMAQLEQEAKIYGLDLEADKADLTGYQISTGYQEALLRSRTDQARLSLEAASTKAQVTASTHNAALSAQAQITGIRLEQDAKIYGLDVEKARANIDGWKSYASALVEKFRAFVAADQNAIQSQLGVLNARVESRKLKASEAELKMRGKIADYEGKIKNSQMEKELILRANQSALDAYAAAASTLGQIAAAAIHVMNGMASNQITTTKKG
jgi:hypothetical protein